MDKIFLHEQLAGLFLLLHGRGGEKEGAPTTALQYLVQNKYTPGNIHSEYMGSAARRGNRVLYVRDELANRMSTS